jgi:adenosylcobinamide amidohydrolase
VPHQPLLTSRHEGGEDVPLLVWRLPAPMLAVSSAPLGGGIGPREWVLNATVPMSYARDDPDAHLLSLAAALGLYGPGVGHLTGVDVARRVSAAADGVAVWATVGLGAPIQAAGPPPDGHASGRPGTINIIAFLPVRLSEAALVNAVITVTEAKVQALAALGLAATGTATDAVTVLCPRSGPAEQYGGPRSRWGAPLARAAYAAVRDPAAAGVPWSDRIR